MLHVTAQAVADCNLMLAPFLPHSANAVDRVLGGTGEVAPMPEIRGGRGPRRRPGATRSSPATTPASRAWGRRPVAVGTPVAKPTPVFTKLDPSVVDEELARLGQG